MLALPSTVSVFMCAQPTDMRRSFDGLSALVTQVIEQSPVSGHLFVFFNRGRNRVKILFWDRSGFCLFYKRLEQGVFHLPVWKEPATRSVTLRASDLSLILEGIDLNGAKRYRRYQLPK